MIKIKLKFTLTLIVTGITFVQIAFNQSIDTRSKQKSFVVYDSVMIPGSKVNIDDYNKSTGLYLSHNPNNYDIILFNEKGEIKYTFNNFGEGPEEYKFLHPGWENFIFWNNKSIAVQVENKLKIYSYNGDYLNTIVIDNNTPYVPRMFFSIYKDDKGDTNLFYYSDAPTQYNMNMPEFYNDTNRKFFINSNIKKKTGKRIINYEKTSIYKNGEVYYTHLEPIYSLNKQKRVVDVILPNEQQLYRYGLDNGFRLVKSFTLDADYFGELTGTPFGKRAKSLTMLRNSFYARVFSFADTVITFYWQGLDEDEMPSSFDEMNTKLDKIHKYLQLFINDKKVGGDIKLPDDIRMINVVHNSGKIIFTKEPTEYEEYNLINKFYIAKLE